MLRHSLLPALISAGLVALAPTTAQAAAAEDPPERRDWTGATLSPAHRKDAPAAIDRRLLRGATASALFGPYTAHPTGSWPESVAIGDVTGDGRADVVLSTGFYFDEEHDYKLFVYAQQADGSLADPVEYVTWLTYSSGAGLTLLDANSDGRLDVALGTANGVEIFTQTTEGTLDSQGLQAGTPPARQLSAADLDGDGDTDLVTGGSGVTLMLQEPDGTFTSSEIHTSAVNVVRTGDVTGDGRADVIAQDSSHVIVLANDGSGWTAQTTPVLPERINNIEVADVTNDRRADVVVTMGGNRPSSQLAVLPQTARGALGKAVVYPVADIPEPVKAADVNRDGRTDVVLAHGGWMQLSTLTQRANRRLNPPVAAALPYASSYHEDGLALGDINGDGTVDAVIADYNHGLVVVPGQ